MRVYPLNFNLLRSLMWVSALFLLLPLVSPSIANVNDCTGLAGKAQRQCLDKKDAGNEKHAKSVKPKGKEYRTVADEKQLHREMNGRPRDDKLHFSKQKPVSGTQAAKSNGYGNDRPPPKGYIECEFKPATKMKEAKVAGGHGNKREQLVAARDVRKDCKGAKYQNLPK